MNPIKIALYLMSRKYFFDLLYSINCKPERYVGCTNVRRYFDIKRVERQQLIDAGLGVKISKPVVVERGLNGDGYMFSTLSHNGVLAIYSCTYKHKYQLTNLVSGRQAKVKVGSPTNTGFYDDSMVVLAWKKALGVCSVKAMFQGRNLGVLKRIGHVKADYYTDVSRLHSTRVLVFRSGLFILHEFDVDTREIRKLDIGKRIHQFASLTGIDVGVKGVFRERGDTGLTHSLNDNYTTSPVLECDPGWPLCVFIPSASHPEDIRKGLKIYDDRSIFTDTTERRQLTDPFRFQYYHSIVRVYQNIFLVYDAYTRKWCLVKILVP